MSRIAQVVTRPLISRQLNYTIGYHASLLAGTVLILTGILKLTRLGLNEKEMFFGLLLVVATGLALLILGVLLRIAGMLELGVKGE
jgi:hypothetical protein